MAQYGKNIEAILSHMQTIETRFHGPTNTKGSRYSARNADGKSVILSTDFALNSDENHARAAIALCEKMGWDGQLIGGQTKAGRYTFVFVP